MPILVTCKCGKKFRADEKHVGKQKPCPKCGQPLDIAGPHVSAYDVFVSYSSKDKTTCDALVATFERKGMRCWIAPRDILPGMNWGEAIIGGIEQSRVMALVFSAHSNESPQVKREVERAVSKGIPVIPLRIEDVKLSRAMEYFISSQHWLDALTPPLENHLEELARKVTRLLSDDGSSAAGPGRSGSESIPKAIQVSEWTAPAPDPFSLEPLSSGPMWPASPTVNDPSPLGPNYLLRREARRGSWWSHVPLHLRWIAIGIIAIGLMLWTGMSLFKSGTAVVRVQIKDPDVQVVFQGQTLNNQSVAQDLELKPGEYTFKISYGSLEFVTDAFKLKAGENAAVVVELGDRTLTAKIGKLEIGQWPVAAKVRAVTTPNQPTVAAAKSTNEMTPDIKPTSVPSTVQLVDGVWTWSDPIWIGPTIDTADAVEATAALSSDELTIFFTRQEPGRAADIWTASRLTRDAPFGAAIKLRNINTNASNEGAPAITADGLTLFFDSQRPGGEGVWDVWSARRASVNAPFDAPENLGKPVNTAASEGVPTLTGDGLDLVFHSSRPGGNPPFSIWMSTRPRMDATFSDPVMLGPNINTPGRDYDPAISSDGRALVFVSDRSGGVGGDDLWMSIRVSRDAAFGPAVNLGPKINTAANEYKPSLSSDGRTLYFGSPRGGEGELWYAKSQLPSSENTGAVVAKGDPPLSAKEETPASDLAAMQGVWHAVTEEYQGAAISPAESLAMNKTLTVKDNSLVIERSFPDGNRKKLNGIIQLLPDTSPKQFNWSGTDFDGNALELLGMYELDPDTFRIVYTWRGKGSRTPRPTKFASAGDGGGSIVNTFRAMDPASKTASTELFNGSDLTGWTPVASAGGWSAENGILASSPGDGWLASDRDYGDFELELEYKIPPNGNTGVFLRAPPSGDPSGAGLLEVQAIDDKAAPFQNEPDFKRTGAVWGLFGGKPRADAPTGKWNKLTIRAVGPRITVVVNDTKVTEGNLADEPDAALKPNMKLPTGRIGLQRRAATGAEFRNIRIREIQPAPTNADSSGTDKSAPSKSNSDGTTNSTTPPHEPNNRITSKSTWSAPTNLGPEVNSGFADSQPAISADGLTLVFVSWRNGGKGSADLWMSERTSRNEPFVAAVNLQSVNTGKDETQPRLSSDRLKLAYSIGDQLWYSERPSLKDPFPKPRQVTAGSSPNVRDHTTTGDGLARFTSLKLERPHAQGEVPIDLCLSIRDSVDGVFGSETPLGSDVNGPAIDQGPSVTADGQILVFQSNRQGGIRGESAYDLWMTLRKTTDVDRRAAEWVQSVKGFVDIQIVGQASVRRIGADRPLPTEEFRVLTVNLYLNSNADDAGIINLKGLSAIKNLYIHGSAKITRTGLINAGLAEMQTLEDLGPMGFLVDIKILEEVGKLTNLRTLTLDGSGNLENTLQHISGLKKLETLSLTGTSITDAGLELLHGLKNLKVVRLVNANNVTADGVSKLRSALPNCKVEQ